MDHKFLQSLGGPTKAPTNNNELYISLENPLLVRAQPTEEKKK